MFILDFSEINLEMFPPLVTKYLISNIVLVPPNHCRSRLGDSHQLDVT